MKTVVQDFNSRLKRTSGSFYQLDNPAIATHYQECPFVGYSSLSPVKNDLRIQNNVQQLEVWGQIVGSTGDVPEGFLSLEIWHRSTDSDRFWQRARFYADENGAYQFITDLPARETGMNYHIYFKIMHRGKFHFTSLSFNNSMAWISTYALKSGFYHKPTCSEPFSGPTRNRWIFQFDIRLSTDQAGVLTTTV